MNAHDTAPVPPPGCPAHGSGARVPLHGPEFAAHPQAYYEYLRHYGAAAPVELAPGVEATLVTDYAAALQLLQDSGTFRKDARRWRAFNEGRISPDSPVVPLLAHRHNCMFADGADHLRLRQAVTDSMARVDTRRLSRSTEQTSGYLISQFAARGSADLLGDYAKQLPLFVFNELFGCPADIGDRVMFGISGMFDGVNAEKAAAVLFEAVGELVTLKRRKPGDDVASWLMQHEARLDDEETVHQIALLLSAGAEPLRNLLGNTLHRLLTHERYAREGGLIDEALDDTLWENAPMANFAPHYPAVDTELAGQRMQAGDLVLVQLRRRQHRSRPPGVPPGGQQPRAPRLERGPARVPVQGTGPAHHGHGHRAPAQRTARRRTRRSRGQPDVASGPLQPRSGQPSGPVHPGACRTARRSGAGHRGARAGEADGSGPPGRTQGDVEPVPQLAHTVTCATPSPSAPSA